MKFGRNKVLCRLLVVRCVVCVTPLQPLVVARLCVSSDQLRRKQRTPANNAGVFVCGNQDVDDAPEWFDVLSLYVYEHYPTL